METGLSRNRAISELSRSSHGKLDEYLPVGVQMAREDPWFFAHLVSWNHKNGQVRDSKVALPLISLLYVDNLNPYRGEIRQNALAHLADLSPRDLLRGYRWYGQDPSIAPWQAGRHQLRKLIVRYLKAQEQDWGRWQHSVLQHRKVMKELYALSHYCSQRAKEILFENQKPAGSVFRLVAELKTMSPEEIAGSIIIYKIPFLVALGAAGPKLKEEAVVMALIQAMSPTELVTNTAMLERLGLKTSPTLRAALEKALEKAGTSKRATFKTSRAAGVMKDERLQQKLSGLQEKQIKALGGVEGDWLVLGDRSGSMALAIETARIVAGTLAKMVKGAVHLVFFDRAPQYFDVTGMDYDSVCGFTRSVVANGATSIGCGLKMIHDKGIVVQGIAIVSDGLENTPPRFTRVYKSYCENFGIEPPVYLYRCATGGRSYADDDLADSMRQADLELQEFDLTAHKVDYYSLPNLVQTMRTARYSLVDEIMSTPLLTVDQVLRDRVAALV